ncbi:MAG: phage holin family protein [Acidobacteria bacterium]|nr:phage holin family protein [Acidobacteriota bacterium]
MKFLIRWGCNALAIYAAIKLLPGLTFTGAWWQLCLVALILGLLNALVRPLLEFLTCPLILLTLGLFVLVINAMLLLFTSAIANALDIPFHIASFWSAFWGALVISIISSLLSLLVTDDE